MRGKFVPKGQVMKKAIAILLAALLAAAPLSAVFADGEELFSVTLFENGKIEWKRIEGAGTYWIGINGSFLPAGDVTEYSLTEQGGISDPGTYDIEIDAYNADSTEMIRNTVITVRYEGEKFLIQGAPSGSALHVVSMESGALFRVTLYESGRIEWGRIDGAETYWIGINGGFIPVGNVTEYGLYGQGGISEPGSYYIEISAYNADSTELISNTVINVEYDGEKFFVQGPPAGPISSDTDAPMLIATGPKTGSGDSSNTMRTILIAASAILGVAAIVAVAAIEIAAGKKKDAGR